MTVRFRFIVCFCILELAIVASSIVQITTYVPSQHIHFEENIRGVESDEPQYFVGYLDHPENSSFRLQTPSFGVTIDEEIFFQGFETNGHAICVYGEFLLNRNDLELEFAFVDQTGLNEILSSGVTTRTHLRGNYYSNHTWNEILPIEFQDSTVSTWYVILCVGAYPAWEPDRVGWLFCGRDLTPPESYLYVDNVIEGDVVLPLTLEESNCELATVEVKICGNRIYNDPKLSGKELTISIPWDSTTHSNGLCQIWVNVSDTGGAFIIRTWTCTIQNQPPPTIPEQPLYNITEFWTNIIEGITNPYFVIGLFFVFGTTTLKMRKAANNKSPILLLLIWISIFIGLLFSGLALFVAFLFQGITFVATFVTEANDAAAKQKVRGREEILQAKLDAVKSDMAEKDRKLEELEKRIEKVELEKKINDDS